MTFEWLRHVLVVSGDLLFIRRAVRELSPFFLVVPICDSNVAVGVVEEAERYDGIVCDVARYEGELFFQYLRGRRRWLIRRIVSVRGDRIDSDHLVAATSAAVERASRRQALERSQRSNNDDSEYRDAEDVTAHAAA
jgi:hypothetical protein